MNKLFTQNSFSADVITRLNLLEFLSLSMQKRPMNIEDMALMKTYFNNNSTKSQIEQDIAIPSGALFSYLDNDYLDFSDKKEASVTEKGHARIKIITDSMNTSSLKSEKTFDAMSEFCMIVSGFDQNASKEELGAQFAISLRKLTRAFLSQSESVKLPSAAILYYLYIFDSLTHNEILKYIPQRSILQIQAIIRNNIKRGYAQYLSKNTNKKIALTQEGRRKTEEIANACNYKVNNYASNNPKKADRLFDAVCVLNDAAGELIYEKKLASF